MRAMVCRPLIFVHISCIKDRLEYRIAAGQLKKDPNLDVQIPNVDNSVLYVTRLNFYPRGVRGNVTSREPKHRIYDDTK